MANISKYDPGQELSSLNFGNLIGGPLSAVVEAQILAAKSTVDYIKRVGFDENGDPEYVTFTYPKEIAPYQVGIAGDLKVTVNTSSSDYNVIPFVKVIGNGFGAEAEAIISDKEVTRIIVTNNGQDYTQVDSVVVLKPDGIGAEFEIESIDPQTGIEKVKVIETGSGYTHPPVIEFAPGTKGQGAILESIIDSNGQVVDVIVIDGGAGYLDTDKKNISPINPTGSGTTLDIIFSSGTPSQPAQFVDMKLEVPLLTMVPIPYIRVEETTINFNAKINSVEKVNSSQDIDASFSLSNEKESKFSGSEKGTKYSRTGRRRRRKTTKSEFNSEYSGSKKTKFNVSASYKRKDSRGTEIDKTYTMGITVKAVQDEIPAGMEKVLGILENAIISQPSS